MSSVSGSLTLLNGQNVNYGKSFGLKHSNDGRTLTAKCKVNNVERYIHTVSYLLCLISQQNKLAKCQERHFL